MLLYTVLILLGAGVMTFSAAQLKTVNVTAVRMVGSPYYVDHSSLRNQFLVRIINKHPQARTFRLDAVAAGQVIELNGVEAAISVAPMAEELRPVVVRVKREDYRGPFDLTIRVLDDSGSVVNEDAVEFLGPNPAVLKP